MAPGSIELPRNVVLLRACLAFSILSTLYEILLILLLTINKLNTLTQLVTIGKLSEGALGLKASTKRGILYQYGRLKQLRTELATRYSEVDPAVKTETDAENTF